MIFKNQPHHDDEPIQASGKRVMSEPICDRCLGSGDKHTYASGIPCPDCRGTGKASSSDHIRTDYFIDVDGVEHRSDTRCTCSIGHDHPAARSINDENVKQEQPLPSVPEHSDLGLLLDGIQRDYRIGSRLATPENLTSRYNAQDRIQSYVDAQIIAKEQEAYQNVLNYMEATPGDELEFAVQSWREVKQMLAMRIQRLADLKKEDK